MPEGQVGNLPHCAERHHGSSTARFKERLVARSVLSLTVGASVWEPRLYADLELVEHQINDYAGYADIHPDRPGPLGESAVTGELSFKGPAEGYYRQHGDGYG